MAVLLSAILTRAQRDMTDYSTSASTTQFLDYMSEMENKIFNEVVRRTTYDSTSLSGTTNYYYTYPTGITFNNIHPKGIYYNKKWYKKVDTITGIQVDTDNDSKYICWDANSKLNMNPTPTTTDAISIPYRYMPSSFAGTTQNINLEDDFQHAYVYYAQAMYSRDVLRDEQKFSTYMAAYLQQEERIKKWWARYSQEETVETIGDEYVDSY